MVHEAFADEEDLFDTLLAGERVWELLDTACTSSVPPAARLAAARELRELLATQPDALEEARSADAVYRLSQAADSCPVLSADVLALRTLLLDATPQHTAATHVCLPREAGTLRLFTLVGKSTVLGGRLWASAQLLVTHILAHEDMADLTVLELGAGAGLAGLAALHLGAGRVTLSDTPSVPELLELLAKNAAANPHPGTGAVAHVLPLDWTHDGGAAAFDVVLASDVLYHEELAQPLARTVAAHLKPGGSAHLVCPVRSASILDACVGHASALGLTATRRMLDHQEEGHDYSFEYIKLQWAPR